MLELHIFMCTWEFLESSSFLYEQFHGSYVWRCPRFNDACLEVAKNFFFLVCHLGILLYAPPVRESVLTCIRRRSSLILFCYSGDH